MLLDVVASSASGESTHADDPFEQKGDFLEIEEKHHLKASTTHGGMKPQTT